MEIIKLTPRDERYPDSLRAIHNPPKQLYCIGDLELLKRRCVCIIGSRKTSEYGRGIARKIASKLAGAGIVVVSGLAIGIDTAAHRGALESGTTIAVTASGPDVPYPWSNKELRDEIVRKGLLISENEPGSQAMKYSFPQRNRIISGISECGIIVEAGLNSGALITAELLAEEGKPLYAVPANINSGYSLGSNMLIRDGVPALTVIDDIFDLLGVSRSECIENTNLGADEKKIMKLLMTGREYTIDELSKALKIGVSTVSGMITVMEMKGLVFTAGGKIFVAF